MANIGRNEPCPCGSGKKYKQCHGKADLKSPRSQTRKSVDGNLTFSLPIKLDELGPPFGWKEFVIVSHLDETKLKPGEHQPTPVGFPGKYKVIFTLARPEISLTQIDPSDVDLTEGDSSLVITSPEPRTHNDPSGVWVDIPDDERETEGNRIMSFFLKPNRFGRLGRISTKVEAKSYRHARSKAYEKLLPFLSNLSYQYNIPIEIKGTHTEETATSGTNLEFRLPFFPQRFTVSPELNISKEISILLGHYREGMNSNSINYSFLCFYRILEAIYDRREKQAQLRGVRYQFPRKNTITEADLMALQKHMNEYSKFIGKKFRYIYERYLTPLRVKIAHGLITTEGLFENTADDLSIRNRTGYLIPIAQIIAKIEIQNDLAIKVIPKS